MNEQAMIARLRELDAQFEECTEAELEEYWRIACALQGVGLHPSELLGDSDLKPDTVITFSD